MEIDEIYVGQLLVIRKLEEIPDEINDNMKTWCGRTVKVAFIDKDVNGEPGPVIVRLAECLDEEWFAEDFEKEVLHPYEKSPDYPFYTPSEKSIYTSGKENPTNLTPPSWYKPPKKINPNKAFKDKKCGAPKKTWKITEMGTSTGRININGPENQKAKIIVEYNHEKRAYEYVEMEANTMVLGSGVQIVTLTPEQLNNRHVVYNLNTDNIKKKENTE